MVSNWWSASSQSSLPAKGKAWRVPAWRWLAAAGLLLTGLWLSAPGAAAQDVVQPGRGWSMQAKIPGYFQNTLPPKMVADQNRTVHAFTTMPLSDDPNDSGSGEFVIYYSQWTLADGWSKPNDIVLSPIKQQGRVKDVVLDKAGIIHLVFFGGDEYEANIYYTWAPAARAGDARAWAPVTAIGPGPITPDVAGLATDGDGNFVLVYSGNLGEGSSLYAVYSNDGGASWSEPVLVFSTYTLTDKAFDFQIAYGASGAVHLVWNVTDYFGQNVGGYYAQLNNLHDQVWSQPVSLDKQVGLGIAIPAVVEYGDSILILYNNGLEGQVAPVQWMLRSDDGGKTWSQPIRPFPNHIGRNGTISFVVDGANVLHVFFGQRTSSGAGQPAIHGMWHSVWNNGWGPLLPVASAPQSESFDPYDARAVVSQGNVILLTWRTDPGRKDVWPFYATTTLDLSESPVIPLLTPATAEENAAEIAAAEDAAIAEPVSSTPTASGLLSENEPSVSKGEFSTEGAAVQTAGPAAPLVMALAPTIVFIVAALLIGSLRRRR